MSTIVIERAVVKQALEAMLHFSGDISDEMFESIRALKAALAQEKAEPKPMNPELRKMWEEHFDRCFRAMPLPTQEQPK